MSAPDSSHAPLGQAMREFPLGVVLTATTGKMLCEEGFGAFHEFAEFLTGGPVWSHEFASRELSDLLKRDVLRQHPHLPTTAEVTRESFPAWITEARRTYGDTVAITPIPDYGRTKGPLETLAEIAGDKPIIAVKLP